MVKANRPTLEFRREAVRRELTRGRTRRKFAEDLGWIVDVNIVADADLGVWGGYRFT